MTKLVNNTILIHASHSVSPLTALQIEWFMICFLFRVILLLEATLIKSEPFASTVVLYVAIDISRTLLRTKS